MTRSCAASCSMANRREIRPATMQPLCDCIAQGDVESVRGLLDADSSLVNATFYYPGDDRPNRARYSGASQTLRHRPHAAGTAYSNRAIYDAAEPYDDWL